MQPAEEPGDRVTLVPGQAEPVAQLLYRDPPFLSALFLHELLQQFRHPGIFSHGVSESRIPGVQFSGAGYCFGSDSI